jgi:hypothetical protein
LATKHLQAMIAITQPWRTKDGRWMLPHFALPNLQAQMLKLLCSEPNPKSVASAVAITEANVLDDAAGDAPDARGSDR